jgi:hypothetical protein
MYSFHVIFSSLILRDNLHVKSLCPQLNPCVTRNILYLQRGYSLAFTRCKITGKEKKSNSIKKENERSPEQKGKRR